MTGTATLAAEGRRCNEEMAADPSGGPGADQPRGAEAVEGLVDRGGVPTMAMSRATPSTAPIWRAVWLMAPPVPKRSCGRSGDGGGAEHREGERDADADQERPGQPMGEVPGVGVDGRDVDEQSGREGEAAGDEHGSVADACGEPSARATEGGDEQGPGRDRQPRLQGRVLPHRGQEQHVGQAASRRSRPSTGTSRHWRARPSAIGTPRGRWPATRGGSTGGSRWARAPRRPRRRRRPGRWTSPSHRPG